MDWNEFLTQHWDIKFVSIVLIVAAWIDGKELRVPNWITYPMVLSGLIYCTWMGGLDGLGASLLGMCVGLLCLLPLYAVGGMGAGDVKLMAGMGAWVGVTVTLYAFAVSAVVGAIMAICMVLYSKNIRKHYDNAMIILMEWLSIRDPKELSRIAAERKPTMFLLPYGIPICVGSIGYFFYANLI